MKIDKSVCGCLLLVGILLILYLHNRKEPFVLLGARIGMLLWRRFQGDGSSKKKKKEIDTRWQ